MIINDLNNKIILITGGTSGIGYEAARYFSLCNATIIVTGSNNDKGINAISNIKNEYKDANIKFIQCDFSTLENINNLSNILINEYSHIDVLINNAGICRPEKRYLTKEGHEVQFGINYLSHYLLTLKLIPLLEKANDPKIINVSSLAATFGKINFKDIESTKKYSSTGCYSQSKLACQIMSYHFGCEFRDTNSKIKSICVHPGVAKTELFKRYSSIVGKFLNFGFILFSFLFQNSRKGSRTIINAVIDDSINNLDYLCPRGLFHFYGKPKKMKYIKKARKEETINKLIDLSNSYVESFLK
jgi:NAD(P)-dependent dehydrogenase (short-subunit alcohol dehydrogenase family)